MSFASDDGGDEPEDPVETSLFTPRRVKIGGLTIGALAAMVGSYMGIKKYRALKNRLKKKYGIERLTSLQEVVWLASLLGRYKVTWPLYGLVRMNQGTLTDFVGADPSAVAELYYGHEPSKKQVSRFVRKFFAGQKA